MNETKTIFIFGGAGFVGRALTEKYLKNDWRVIISTRAKNFEEAKSQLLLHSFDKNLFGKSFSNNSLLFAFDVDLTDEKWSQTDIWIQLLKRINVPPSSMIRVINFVGETSKSADEILKSNVNTLESIFILVRYIKSQNKNSLFANMGSAVERRRGKRLSPYEYAKGAARQQIEKINLCDFHFAAHYIKGRGEQKMKSAAPILWSKLKFSHRWLFGFKVGVVDVDDLAGIIFHFLEEIKIPLRGQKLVEVNVTNGELVFRDIIRNLLPEDKRSIPKAIIPARLEGLFLWIYSVIVPILRPNDQFARRLANFAKRSLTNHKTPKETGIFKTAEDIKKLASDNDYEVLERSPNLIVLSKRLPVIYVLKEKNQEELKRVVRKALVT